MTGFREGFPTTSYVEVAAPVPAALDMSDDAVFVSWVFASGDDTFEEWAARESAAQLRLPHALAQAGWR